MAVVIGVTGSIGSGKSSVLEMFAELGAETASADAIAREVLGPGQPAANEVVAEFGPEIARAGGEIDRKKLADKIFRDPSARERLNRITHPRIIARIEEIVRDFRARRGAEPDAVLAVEIPLLFECGLREMVDKVVVAAAEQETLISRLMSRDGLSREAAEERLSAQAPLSEKIKLADWVVWTDRSFEDTRRQVRHIFQQVSGQG